MTFFKQSILTNESKYFIEWVLLVSFRYCRYTRETFKHNWHAESIITDKIFTCASPAQNGTRRSLYSRYFICILLRKWRALSSQLWTSCSIEPVAELPWIPPFRLSSSDITRLAEPILDRNCFTSCRSCGNWKIKPIFLGKNIRRNFLISGWGPHQQQWNIIITDCPVQRK